MLILSAVLTFNICFRRSWASRDTFSDYICDWFREPL